VAGLSLIKPDIHCQEKLSPFLKRANTKMAFWASLKELSSVSRERIGAKERV